MDDTQAPNTAAQDEEYVEEPLIKEPPADGIKRRWYAVHAHSGQEGAVLASLRARAQQQGMQDMITNVLVPMEEVAEFRAGEKKTSKRKFFPGYMLVQMELTDDTWHLVKSTPKISGFVVSATQPPSVPETEVRRLTRQIDEGAL